MDPNSVPISFQHELGGDDPSEEDQSDENPFDEDLSGDSPHEYQCYGKIGINGEYQYYPLNHDIGKQVRLLVLHPGSGEDEIRCSITHTNLDEAPFFEAVSYTWATEDGDDRLCRWIFVREPGGFVRVTANCEAAFRRIRRVGVNRIIWIDSVCINQSDISERNHQVDLMASIYSSASRVIIYLGEEDWASAAVFNQLPTNGYYDEPYGHFLSRRWFHRAWVIQEVALARLAIIICGKQTEDWNVFAKGILHQTRSVTLTITVPTIISRHNITSPWIERNIDFLDILAAGRHCLSTDPRDKVLAFLNLTSDTLQILPNYSESAQSLFTEVVTTSIKKRQDLRILSYCEDQGLPNLPSWVPDWTMPSHFLPLPPQFPLQHVVPQPHGGFSTGQGLFQYDSLASCAVGLRLRAQKLGVICKDPWYTGDDTLKPAPSRDQTGARKQVVFRNEDCIDSGFQFPWRRFFVHISYWRSFVYISYWSFFLSVWGYFFLGIRVWRSIPWFWWFATAHDWFLLYILFLCPYLFLRPPRACTCNNLNAFWSGILSSVGISVLNADDKKVKVDIPSLFQDGTRCFHLDVGKYKAWHEQHQPGKLHLSFIETVIAWSRNRLHPCGVLGKSHQRYDETEANKFTKFTTQHASGRRLFLTKKSLGIGPRSLRPGDSVWYLEGARVPFILRQDGPHYVLVGECYLHNALELNTYHWYSLTTQPQPSWKIIEIR
jgi:hypothetical protein